MERDYITFEETRKIIAEEVEESDIIQVNLKKSCGYALAEDIFSPVDLPLWTNSAVDGYGFNTKSLANLPAELKVIGEIKAGEAKKFKIELGEAVKLYTGALIPDGVDAVIEVEKVEKIGDKIVIKEKVKEFCNIRSKGEEVKKGQKVIEKGTEITPGVVGFLSSMGIKEVKVRRKPKVGVIVTGSEILRPGSNLKEGKIYESNSVMLLTGLRKFGIEKIRIAFSKDDFKSLRKRFYSFLDECDIIIFTGGVSVGDYDFVRVLVERENVVKLFYKVQQKPGKPIFMGKKGDTLIFGLPGNPAATLVCFYEYIIPSIKKMMGFSKIFLPEEEKELLNDVKKKQDRLYFLRAKADGDKVFVLPNQDSHMLSSFVNSNALVLAPKEVSYIQKGEKVKVHILT
jgi:molybdopterin molybdotransferase